jgi:DNA-binding CsgD family transcriptional regulator
VDKKINQPAKGGKTRKKIIKQQSIRRETAKNHK